MEKIEVVDYPNENPTVYNKAFFDKLQTNVETAISESKTTVTDSLDSTSATEALSANQGYLLGNRVTALEKTSYFNGTTTSINDLNTNGKWRGYISTGTEDATYLGFAGNVIVETFMQANTTPCMQRITQMTTGRTVIRYCATNSFSYSDSLICVAIPVRQSYTITSNKFEHSGDNVRNSYIQEGNKVTLFITFKTKTELTAKTSYTIDSTIPKPSTYFGSVGGFQGTICVGTIFVNSSGQILITPAEAVASGKEFNAQIVYFTS